MFRDQAVVKLLGQYRSLSVVGLSATGAFSSPLPDELQGRLLEPSALVDGQAVAGSTRSFAYVLIPLHLSTAEKSKLHPPIPYEDTAVLVAARTVTPPVNGLGYFVLVGLVVLAVATALAYYLARRFSRPLQVAAATTGRIAGGDLQARMPVTSKDLDEFAALATAINAMGESLERAQNQQRQFLLSVSHDLRTPLTSIRGYADAALDGTTDDVAGALRVIVAEATRLERLVQDLLDLARLDAERFSFHLERVDVADVVRQTVARFVPEAVPAGVSLRTALGEGEHLWVRTDADRLVQLLSNLVENAFKFAASADRRRRPRGSGRRRALGGRRRSRHRADGPHQSLRAPLHLGSRTRDGARPAGSAWPSWPS